MALTAEDEQQNDAHVFAIVYGPTVASVAEFAIESSAIGDTEPSLAVDAIIVKASALYCSHNVGVSLESWQKR
jgi:hypothetical protein